MTMSRLARLLETTQDLTPTGKTQVIDRAWDNFNPIFLSKILTLDLRNNNIGTQKGIKWIAKAFDVFDDEVTALYSAFEDIGTATMYLESDKEKEEDYSLSQIITMLEYDCMGHANSFLMVKEILLSLSSLERKWFVRYWLRNPNNGIGLGVITKSIAKHYGKKVAQVKKDMTMNSVETIVTHYENGTNPPLNLVHGKFVKPMLAKEVAITEWPEEQIVDYKYDGNRYQIHLNYTILGPSVIIFNRKGNVVTSQFPDVQKQISSYNRQEKYPTGFNCILDGEIYPINRDGSPAPHKLMATRVHSKNKEEAVKKVPVKWVAFDCLKYNDEVLIDLPYKERLEKFKELPDQAHRMEEGGDALAFYNQAISHGFEGIIVKDANMAYEPSKRSKGWAKYKPPRIELDVVILGATYGENSKSSVFSSFEIAVKDGDEFVSLGKVGNGFSDMELLSMTSSLRKIVDVYENDMYRFLPRKVITVTADLVTQNKDGSLGLRFPRKTRLRDDKYVQDIDTLQTVERLMFG